MRKATLASGEGWFECPIPLHDVEEEPGVYGVHQGEERVVCGWAVGGVEEGEPDGGSGGEVDEVGGEGESVNGDNHNVGTPAHDLRRFFAVQAQDHRQHRQ